MVSLARVGRLLTASVLLLSAGTIAAGAVSATNQMNPPRDLMAHNHRVLHRDNDKTLHVKGEVLPAPVLHIPLAVAAIHCDLSETGGFAEAVLHAFMVSGVLRKSSANIEIKLVHSWEEVKSGDEALGLFTRKALTEYPGYTIATTLVSEVDAAPQRCNRKPGTGSGNAGNRGIGI